MARISLFFILIVSLSFNIVFSIHFFKKQEKGSKITNLKLMTPQKQKLDELHKNMNRHNKNIKLKIYNCQQELMQILKMDKVDKIKVNKCLDMISTLQKELQKNSVSEILEIKKVLSIEQCECFMRDLHRNIQQNCSEPGSQSTTQPK
jgi:Spy/CpxP family protein refolding chaperone